MTTVRIKKESHVLTGSNYPLNADKPPTDEHHVNLCFNLSDEDAVRLNLPRHCGGEHCFFDIRLTMEQFEGLYELMTLIQDKLNEFKPDNGRELR